MISLGLNVDEEVEAAPAAAVKEALAPAEGASTLAMEEID
jgi:molecular chaperone HtpG